MVQVITERPARPIQEVESVAGVDDGDGGNDWEPGVTTGIPPGDSPGDVLTWDGDSWEPAPGSTSAFVPYYIAPGETFTVPLYKQALYSMEIDNEGTLDVLGYLLEVD